jgi:branched-chain amino acid transport system substrate-binding protein
VGTRQRSNRDQTLRIGQLAPQGGALSGIFDSVTAPVTLAVNDINAAGGALGNPVSYTLANDGSDPFAARAGLETLRARGRVDAVIGPGSSASAIGIIDDIRRNRLLTCSGSATAGQLSTADSGGYFFRTVPPDQLQGLALAQLVLHDGRRKVGILARDDSYGRGLRTSLKKALTRGGAKVVADVLYDRHTTLFGVPAQRVAGAKPDAVVVIGFEPDASGIVRALTADGLGPQQLPIYGADGMRTTGFADLVDFANPGAVTGIKGTAPATAPAGAHSTFSDAFKATGVNPTFSAYYYDCAILTALAAEKAKSSDPAKMKEAFSANTRGGNKCSTYADCKQLLEEGKTVEYQGASAGFAHMNRFGTLEPKAGVYEIWSFDSAGNAHAEPSDTQIRIG